MFYASFGLIALVLHVIINAEVLKRHSDRDNAEIIKRLLTLHKMEVDHAKNGRECVDMFAASELKAYDAILMDIRMPVLDGLGATGEIRAMERADAKTIPIVALTANAFDEDVQRSLQAGMNAHLTKPVEVKRLIETLQTLV